MTSLDLQECSQICHDAFASVADRHGFPRVPASLEDTTTLITQLHRNPAFHGVVAERDGRVVGSNFLDERSAITSVGPVSVHPDVQGHRIGRKLMNAVLGRISQCDSAGVRLVHMAYNHPAMSLYTDMGFQVREPLAALHGAPKMRPPEGYVVRQCSAEDADSCNALCLRIHGHERGGELSDAIATGAALLVERNKRITAYTTGIGLYGHSVAEAEGDLLALVAAAPEFDPPGFLVPVRNSTVLRWCLDHGLRITCTLNLMTIGFYREPASAYLPSIGY